MAALTFDDLTRGVNGATRLHVHAGNMPETDTAGPASPSQFTPEQQSATMEEIVRMFRGGDGEPAIASAARPEGQPQFTPEQQAATMEEIVRMFRGGNAREPGSDGDAARPVATDERSVLDFAAGLGKSAGVGLAKGAVGLAGVGGDAVALGRWGLDYVAPGSVDKINAAARAAGQTVDEVTQGPRQALPSKQKIAYAARRLGVPVNQLAAAYESLPGSVKFFIQNPYSTSADIRREVEKDTGQFYEPQTTLEGYVERLGEFAPAALSGPSGWVRAAGVAVPAVLSETAGLLTKGSEGEQAARSVAAALGGLGVLRAARPSAAAKRIRKELPADEQLALNAIDRAEVPVRNGAGSGVSLSWPEASTHTSGHPVMMDTLRQLEASPHTRARMAEYFNARPQQIDQAVRRELNGIATVDGAPSSIGPTAGRAAEDYLKEVRGLIDGHANPHLAAGDLRTARSIQTAARERVLQPILEGPIGKLAHRDLTTRNAIDTLFPAQPLANSEREVGRAVEALSRQNPRVASDLVRAYVEETFNRTAQDLVSGANQAGGASFRQQLIGHPQQAANLRAAASALPNGAQKWEGFSRLLDVLEATGKREAAGALTAADATAAQGILAKYKEWKAGQSLHELADLLTDPAAGNRLRAIARMPTGRWLQDTVYKVLVSLSANSAWRQE